MTTNKPEVVAWLHRVRQESDVITDKVRHVWGTPLGSMGEYTEPLIRLSDYEALQAELETVKKVAYGNIELLERNEALQAECEELRKDADRYRWLRDPCSGAERVVTYGRGDYGRGLMSYTMLDGAIDSAMHKAQKKDDEE